MRRFVVLAVCAAWLATGRVAAAQPPAEDELRVLGADDGPLLYDHLLGIVAKQQASRAEAVKLALESPEKIAARREQLRAHLPTMIGALPERTPLNAKTVGTLSCDGYRIEKVVFESRPRHHVTASLYLPTGAMTPVPGVLVPCGHSDNAKSDPKYQSACVLLARNGIAALIFDPIGQGERFQIDTLEEHGTHEHTLVGIGALAAGLNTGHFRIWDGLRAMDYLAARPEVDPRRLGCTGNSGGGTMTTWLMAVDERIVAAAPSCFITTLERLFNTIGPQDCEQHFPNQGPLGVDHTDFITMRAPRPTLILAAEKDFFDFAGTREAYEQARDVYRVLSRPEQVGLFSFNDEHGFSPPRREAAVRWMRRWLVGDDRAIQEHPPKLQTVDALQVTHRGQVLQEFPGEVTVVDLVKRRARELAQRRAATWQGMDRAQRQAAIRRVLAIAAEAQPTPAVKRRGTLARDGSTIEKLILQRDGEVPLPALLVVPQATRTTGKLPATIVVDSRGKAAELNAGGHVERLVKQGRVVLAVDLRGCGETADKRAGGRYQNSEFRTAMVAMHVGRPLLGQRVEDLLAALAVLTNDPRVDGNSIGLVGVERSGPIALHVAALDERIKTLELRDSIGSWEQDVVARPLDDNLMGHVVPGALEHYDLPDLAAMLGERLVVALGE